MYPAPDRSVSGTPAVRFPGPVAPSDRARTFAWQVMLRDFGAGMHTADQFMAERPRVIGTGGDPPLLTIAPVSPKPPSYSGHS
ncbi:hypothetical protein FRUB_08840 [Fimbriiglobus ruber]|uniref:Uncharacterized protein n=1 Tax=Fimbriiglobus ruber TaxID=1908690 RepID=A0A225DJG4_9BACT|nr:hypothetical protein FRUB_08840 [Fimbriiglobus ruber]